MVQTKVLSHSEANVSIKVINLEAPAKYFNARIQSAMYIRDRMARDEASPDVLHIN